jgi:hypothetical protein
MFSGSEPLIYFSKRRAMVLRFSPYRNGISRFTIGTKQKQAEQEGTEINAFSNLILFAIYTRT